MELALPIHHVGRLSTQQQMDNMQAVTRSLRRHASDSGIIDLASTLIIAA